ncbi:transcriptional regulator [Kaistia algarum]|uniref:cupin-like domain-containing protein n=1 Tax=Kaistia algarum TaxID=2083279 RepID=UPI000CE76401|nr:cupin-like domain-containing protein [Kaistia algarum]MCX5514304.1 cupin-like domain-containing protein [Kaistia algarum]PPE79058.1 transcriptional regulator [Kaistia algarum]
MTKLAREVPAGGPLLTFDSGVLGAHFPLEPFTFRHDLAENAVLQLEALAALATQLPRDRIEFNSGRLQPNQRPDETPGVDLEPEEIVRRIETAGAWLVLKNVETIPAYRALIDRVLAEAAEAAGIEPGAMAEPMGFIFVSSANSVTPFHIDYEENFFVHLHGQKFMHVFDNRDRSIIDEEGLETYPGKHRNHAYRDDFEAKGRVFTFGPGDGLFLPYTWPHWVRTGGDWSISMAITWKSPSDRRRNKLYFANAVLRKMGWSQSAPGRRPGLDTAKAAAYDLARLPLEPLRRSEAMRRRLRALLFGSKANYFYGKPGDGSSGKKTDGA